jgi:cold shock CspA family protein
VNSEVEFSLNPEALKRKKYEAVNITGINGLPVQRAVVENRAKSGEADGSREKEIIEDINVQQSTDGVAPALSSPSVNGISTTQEPVPDEMSSTRLANPFPFRQAFDLSIPRYKGIIRYFYEQKGYGFITIPSLSASLSEKDENPTAPKENDIFVYYKDIYYQGPESILMNSVVEFSIEKNSKGYQAYNVSGKK